jgi:alpha-galactosidase/6-phospho-beta-glucosidase family protein
MNVAPTIITEADPDKAYADADFVLITISTAGWMPCRPTWPSLRIMASITLGDTVGPAAGRGRCATCRVSADRRAGQRPGANAVVINYSNPMAQLTKTLALSTDRPVVGLCHGLFETLGSCNCCWTSQTSTRSRPCMAA